MGGGREMTMFLLSLSPVMFSFHDSFFLGGYAGWLKTEVSLDQMRISSIQK